MLSTISSLLGLTHQRRTVSTIAAPGPITLLDTALYRSNEGQLTSTVCSASVTLSLFLELKKQSTKLLQAILTLPPSTSHSSTSNLEGSRNGAKNGKGQQQQQQSTPYTSHLEIVASFARTCLDCASEAIEHLTTDKLASSANLTPETSTGSSSVLSEEDASLFSPGEEESWLVQGVLAGAADTGRRRSKVLAKTDCWESPRLYCPDYVWADDAILHCQRFVRIMARHRFVSMYLIATNNDASSVLDMSNGGRNNGNSSNTADVSEALELLLESKTTSTVESICALVLHELPVKLHQFRRAVESDTAVSKRLYLIKNEYRAPFRAFLEAHVNVQLAPSLDMLDEYLALHNAAGGGDALKKKRKNANCKIQDIASSHILVEALQLEQRCEMMEIGMAKALFPFTELARILDGKRGKIKESGIVTKEDITALEELLRRLKTLLCRKPSPETTTGIRPLLLDLQGVPRDSTLVSCEIFTFDPSFTPKCDQRKAEENNTLRVEKMLSLLACLRDICTRKNGFQTDKRNLEIPSTVVQGCASIDAEMFHAQFADWHDMVKRQRMLSVGSDNGRKSNESDNDSSTSEQETLKEISASILKAEIELSVANASKSALETVRQGLEQLNNDRVKRFEVMEETIRDVCLREMNITVKLAIPEKDVVLALPEMKSALGVFGLQLLMAGEALPMSD